MCENKRLITTISITKVIKVTGIREIKTVQKAVMPPLYSIEIKTVLRSRVVVILLIKTANEIFKTVAFLYKNKQVADSLPYDKNILIYSKEGFPLL